MRLWSRFLSYLSHSLSLGRLSLWLVCLFDSQWASLGARKRKNVRERYVEVLKIVGQWAEWSPPIPEVHSSNLVIVLDIFQPINYCLLNVFIK